MSIWLSSHRDGMFRGSTLVGLLLVALFYPGHRVQGCSCGVPSVEQSLEVASAIFHGTLIEIESLEDDGLPLLWPVRATFEVQAVWKGPVGARLEVVTEIPDAVCGIGYEFLRSGVGSEFVVYGSEISIPQLDPRQTFTTICTRTARFTLDEAEALGEPLWTSEDGIAFVRGDCNADGNVDISDAVRDLRFCFSGASVPCAAACDTDGDGTPCTGVTDGVRLLMYLFRRGAPPPAPFPDCGTVAGEVDCETQSVNCQ